MLPQLLTPPKVDTVSMNLGNVRGTDIQTVVFSTPLPTSHTEGDMGVSASTLLLHWP